MVESSYETSIAVFAQKNLPILLYIALIIPFRVSAAYFYP